MSWAIFLGVSTALALLAVTLAARSEQRAIERARQPPPSQLFADLLHRSNAWHCGCWLHRLHREGVGAHDVPLGRVVRVDSVLGVPVETVELSEAERARLRR